MSSTIDTPVLKAPSGVVHSCARCHAPLDVDAFCSMCGAITLPDGTARPRPSLDVDLQQAA